MFRKLIRFLALPNPNLDLGSPRDNETGSAEIRRAFTAALPRETGSFGIDPDYKKSTAREVGKRQEYANQVPFIFCPEAARRPPKHCDQCGGDSYHHGICNDLLLSGRQLYSCLDFGYNCQGYYCKCTHEGQDHNPQITSTTVVNGQTGTVIYEPITLTQYSNLRYHTTVTVTEVATSTASDGGVGLETALAVVFAGASAGLPYRLKAK
ncbi:hypothetical protein ColLi_09996 [Colletotrichum liriopes]|uniref:Uncharacterized protein n=1 Tax=Colletotrichum liriopes TaxID=708192 RepID=A0AA37GW15_9PEZI|nr:hypothetical protein ColLi_09996 [Colletotrichum liriopes]